MESEFFKKFARIWCIIGLSLLVPAILGVLMIPQELRSQVTIGSAILLVYSVGITVLYLKGGR